MSEKNAFNIIFAIFVLFTVRDVFYRNSGHSHAETKPSEAAIAGSHDHLSHGASMAHMSSVPGIPTMKIQYCQSCGYRQAFDEISKLIMHHYPEIKVEGETHRPNFIRGMICNLVFVAKITILAMIYMNFNPFTYFNMETPSFWTYLTQSKISSSLMILFLCNSIESNMMSTGAFEIFYNDIPVWSKIQTGRMPSGPELIQIVQSQYSFAQKSRIGEFTPT